MYSFELKEVDIFTQLFIIKMKHKIYFYLLTTMEGVILERKKIKTLVKKVIFTKFSIFVHQVTFIYYWPILLPNTVYYRLVSSSAVPLWKIYRDAIGQ